MNHPQWLLDLVRDFDPKMVPLDVDETGTYQESTTRWGLHPSYAAVPAEIRRLAGREPNETGFPSVERVLMSLREANAKSRSDEDVALLVVAFVSRYDSPLPLTNETLAAGMLMLANRHVTAERAEMLIEELANRGQIESEDD